MKKKVAFALTLLALTSLPTFATTEIPMSCSSPKDDHCIGHPTTALSSDLQGEYEIILSDGSNSFVGTFII